MGGVDRYGNYNIILEIKNRFFPVVDLEEIPEHLATFCTSAEGSRFIQENIEKATPADKELVLKELETKCPKTAPKRRQFLGKIEDGIKVSVVFNVMKIVYELVDKIFSIP